MKTIFWWMLQFSAYDNGLLTPLTSHLDDILAANSSITLNAEETLRWLWPFVTKDRYFTYTGSLTTPPYSEVVTWIVCNAVIPLSENQVSSLVELSKNMIRDSEQVSFPGELMKHVYRLILHTN